jgi:hypothetical protein
MRAANALAAKLGAKVGNDPVTPNVPIEASKEQAQLN